MKTQSEGQSESLTDSIQTSDLAPMNISQIDLKQSALSQQLVSQRIVDITFEMTCPCCERRLNGRIKSEVK